ncbi:MAG: hypothetical protein U0996_03980 [Planctomycetaceae bacterium]
MMPCCRFLLCLLIFATCSLSADETLPAKTQADQSSEGTTANGSVPGEGQDEGQDEGQEFSAARMPLSRIAEFVTSGEYRAMRADLFRQLAEKAADPLVGLRPQIREVRYKAVLEKSRLIEGTIDLTLYDENDRPAGQPVSLGPTSLQNLKISDEQGPVELGADSSRRLFLLKSGVSPKLSGTWEADGLISGQTVTFRMELPAATSATLELITAQDIQVTSPGGLVLSPKPVGDKLQWSIVPGQTSRLVLNCRNRRGLSSQTPVTLPAFSASHQLSGDILSSRWTIGLPSELEPSSRLTLRLTRGVRVSSVTMDDQRPLEWDISQDVVGQDLTVRLPDTVISGSFTVSGVTVFVPSETWELPCLGVEQWEISSKDVRGPLLMSPSPVSVKLPAAINVDEWTLKGMQERDVVTAPDQTREYQLTQFGPDATALLRTSSSPPELSDSVVTMLEAGTLLSSARCLVAVDCATSSVVELQWPVAPGWQVFAARNLTTGNALFFETGVPDASGVSNLTVHLAENLEPGRRQLIEVQLQRLVSAELRSLNPPLMTSPQIQRRSSYLVLASGVSTSSEPQRTWSAGRVFITEESFRSRCDWFPENRYSAGMQICSLTDQESVVRPGSADALVTRVEHAVRLTEDGVLEESRIVVPAGLEQPELRVLISKSVDAELRWTVAGAPATATPVSAESSDSVWREWLIPMPASTASPEIIVTCTARHRGADQFVAAIPFPQLPELSAGSLELFSQDEVVLSTSDLTAAPPRAGASKQVSVWNLPTNPTVVNLRRQASAIIQAGQTIDIHMLHLLSEASGGLVQDVMAVANVSRRAGVTSLPLRLPKTSNPLVLVNGHRVQLAENNDLLLIPLPESGEECQVVVAWRESSGKTEQIQGERQLARLFVTQLSAPQCIHHLLIAPELDVRSQQAQFAVSEPTDILLILSRLLNRRPAEGSLQGPSIPPEIRRYVTRWQVAESQGWQQRTMIDSSMSEAPLSIQVTQLRRQFAITTGVALLAVAICLAGRRWILVWLRQTAIIGLALLGVSFFVTAPAGDAALKGGFWGVCAGLMLLIASRWNWLRLLGRHSIFRSAQLTPGLLLLVTLAPDLIAQSAVVSPALARAARRPEADILIPDESVTSEPMVYVRRELLDSWKALTETQLKPPETVVRSLNATILAKAIDSIEVRLEMQVASVTGMNETWLEIPLQNSRLVSCFVDGRKVLADPSGGNAIRVPLPASVQLPPQPLSNETETPAAASAGDSARYTYHTVECRVRPQCVQQASGVQFQVPVMPCPDVTLKVESPSELFSRLRVQTRDDGIIQGTPADGPIRLNGFGLSGVVDVRLLQTELEKGSRGQASVNTLVISESVSGLQTMTCLFRFSGWNVLTPEIRYNIPPGYDLMTVSLASGLSAPASSASTGTDVLWSVQDQAATITLPAGVNQDFVLSMQLQLRKIMNRDAKNDTVSHVPVADLQQFADCVPGASVLVAARTSNIYSVLPPEGVTPGAVTYSDVSAVWGTWLRRTDSLFRANATTAEVRLNFSPRSSLHELQMQQQVTLRDRSLDWQCRMDVETSVLPVFRHRVTLSPAISISEIQVTAGEGNRLASWYRRGDQVILQLREGTIGLHSITIRGQRVLRPDDETVEVMTPILQGAQVLESSMTMTDQDGLGFTVDDVGRNHQSSPPERQPLLKPGTDVRLEMIAENSPIRLKRVASVEPLGAIAAVRSADQVLFVMRLSQWSGSLGPLHMRFSDDAEFLTEPVVLTEREQLPLIREANEFVASQEVVRKLFGEPEFTAVWSMPVRSKEAGVSTVEFPWPEVSDQIRWTQSLLIPLDEPVRNDDRSSAIPAWLISAVMRSAGRDLQAPRVRSAELNVAETLRGNRLLLPLSASRTQAVPKTSDDVFVVASSTVFARPWQSPSGQTELVIFSSRIPSRCTLQIPAGTVVTELESTASTRWEDGQRRQMLVEIDRPVATLRVEWLAQKSEGNWRTSEVIFDPPAVRDSRSVNHVTVLPALGETPSVISNTSLLTADDQFRQLTQELQIGLDHARSGDEEGRIPETDAFSASSFLSELKTSQSQFIAEQKSPAGARIVRAVHEPGEAIRIAYRRRLELETVFPAAVGLFVLMVASFVSVMSGKQPAEASTVMAEPGASGGLSMHDVMSISKDSQLSAQPETSGARSTPANRNSGASVIPSAKSSSTLRSSEGTSHEATGESGQTGQQTGESEASQSQSGSEEEGSSKAEEQAGEKHDHESGTGEHRG